MVNSIVRVTWHDAFADTRSWIEVSEIDQEPCVTVSVGFLIPEAKKGHVTIAQSFNSEETIDSVLFIPQAMIVKTELLS